MIRESPGSSRSRSDPTGDSPPSPETATARPAAVPYAGASLNPGPRLQSRLAPPGPEAGEPSAGRAWLPRRMLATDAPRGLPPAPTALQTLVRPGCLPLSDLGAGQNSCPK